MRYVMYCRKSTDSEDRQVQSIEDQKRELSYVVERRGLRVVKVFTESQSAKNPGRPIFNQMLQMIKDGEADGIVCWKVNRLSRNPVDGGQIQWLLQSSIIKSIITPSHDHLPTDNVLMLSVELGMATQYSLDLARDVARGMRSKVEKGWKPGVAPLGYINDRHGDKGKKEVFADPERFSLVRKMWDLLLTGSYPPTQIAKIARKEWGMTTKKGHPLSVSTLCKMFTNPFYYGDFIFKGEQYKGQHQPMITRDEFDLAQKIMGKKGRPRSKGLRFAFMGMMRCPNCDGQITAEEKYKKLKKTGEMKRYVFYHCSHKKRDKECAQPSVTLPELQRQINEYLDQITIPEEFLNLALDILQGQKKIQETDHTLILQTQQKNMSACIKRIENLLSLYVSPENSNKELLTTEEYKERKNALTIEKGRIEEEIERAKSRTDDSLELTRKTFHFATYAKYWFNTGDEDTQTRIVRSLGQNFSLYDRKFNVELHNPLLVLASGLKDETLQKARSEPTLLMQIDTKNDLREAVFENLSG